MIKVYGETDDLLEIEGDITEEFMMYEGTRYLSFSNGVVLRVSTNVHYNWTIRALRGHELVSIVPAAGDGYGDSDVAHIVGTVDWVVFGDAFVKASK